MIHQTFPAAERGRGQVPEAHPVRGTAVPAATSWHKWRQILPALRLARDALGLNRSRIDLIEKLMACVPGDLLATGPNGELIVHVSNARLAQMTNRDGDKTVTRLISELVALGLLARKSSPNGKRYMRRAPDGSCTAYGLDLAPLLARMPEIEERALAAQAEAETCRRLRERCSLAIREIEETCGTEELLRDARKLLRRKPVAAELSALLNRLATQISGTAPESCQPENVPDLAPADAAPPRDAAIPRRSAPRNGRHKYPAPNLSERFASSELPEAMPARSETRSADIALTPQLVAEALPRTANAGRQLDATLRDFVQHLVLALGISAALWRSTLQHTGFEDAALLVMVLYERQSEIRNPPGYLRHLLRSDRGETRLGARLLAEHLHRRASSHRQNRNSVLL